MQEAVPVGKGKMIAVLGLKTNEVLNLLELKKDINGVCEIANDNADGQVILSGNKECLDQIQILFKNNKKKLYLKVSAPFHCTLMKPAADNAAK